MAFSIRRGATYKPLRKHHASTIRPLEKGSLPIPRTRLVNTPFRHPTTGREGGRGRGISGRNLKRYGEEHNPWGDFPLPLAASCPPEGPLYTSPNHSPTSDTRPDSPVADAGPSFGFCAVQRLSHSFHCRRRSHQRSVGVQAGTLHLI